MFLVVSLNFIAVISMVFSTSCDLVKLVNLGLKKSDYYRLSEIGFL